MEEIRIPSGSEGFAKDLEEIEQECFHLPMTGEQIRALLGNEHTAWFAVRDDGRLLGSLWMQTVLDEGYIGNVGVRQDCRRRGIADRLMRMAAEYAAEKQLSFLTLEVRAGNDAALALYGKHGFLRTGLRPGYYSAPKEDAVIMTRTFGR